MVKVCSCEGLNPDCDKCFGSGIIQIADSKSTKPVVADKPQKTRYESRLPEDIKQTPRKELENIAQKILLDLDSKSKKQMQILNSIPFSTTTFRRDFKEKFETLRMLENDKRFLRGELTRLIQETTDTKQFQSFQYGPFLSDKEIDVSNNRQLKELIRGYKKTKQG